jgi:hypothetical protein
MWCWRRRGYFYQLFGFGCPLSKLAFKAAGSSLGRNSSLCTAVPLYPTPREACLNPEGSLSKPRGKLAWARKSRNRLSCRLRYLLSAKILTNQTMIEATALGSSPIAHPSSPRCLSTARPGTHPLLTQALTYSPCSLKF